MLCTPKVDLSNLSLVLFWHALQLQVGSDLHGPHSPGPKNQALTVPGGVKRLHSHQLFILHGMFCMLKLAQHIVDSKPLVDSFLLA